MGISTTDTFGASSNAARASAADCTAAGAMLFMRWIVQLLMVLCQAHALALLCQRQVSRAMSNCTENVCSTM